MFIVADMIRPWKYHLLDLIPQFENIYHTGLENGEIEFGLFSTVSYITCCYYVGLQPLPELKQRIETYREVLQHYGQDTTLNYININYQSILNFMGESDDPKILVGEAYDEKRMMPEHIKAEDDVAILYLLINKMILNYYFSDYEQATRVAMEVVPYMNQIVDTFRNAYYCLYASLSFLGLMREHPELVSKARRRELLNQIDNNQKRLRLWSRSAPMNNQHKWMVVEAERALVRGKIRTAGETYDNALRHVKNHVYKGDEALINLQTARFWLRKGDEKRARVFMAETRYIFGLWGAKAVVKHLEQEYPVLHV